MKRKEKYTSPVFEVNTFTQDVLTISGPDNFGEYIWGDDEWGIE